MSEFRVEVTGEDQFSPREWLRREVLWASLMSPYDKQLKGWLDGTAVDQHNGNVSRRALYAQDTKSVESQALAFFNQGKNLGGIISSAALFKTCTKEKPRRDEEPLSAEALSIQARYIDIVLGSTTLALTVIPQNDKSIYSECAGLVSLVTIVPATDFAGRHRLLQAAKRMTGLAQYEATAWLGTAKQDEAVSLPVLTINNGGHPRSAGSRVEMLQPIFQAALHSEPYEQLSVAS